MKAGDEAVGKDGGTEATAERLETASDSGTDLQKRKNKAIKHTIDAFMALIMHRSFWSKQKIR